MKKLLYLWMLVVLLPISFTAGATDYYSISNGEAGNTKTWNTQRDGSGAMPLNFNDATDNFIVQTGFAVYNNTIDFICNGSLIIESGGMFTTGNTGRTILIASVVAINQESVFQLQPKTVLTARCILVQGTLQNNGGTITPFTALKN